MAELIFNTCPSNVKIPTTSLVDIGSMHRFHFQINQILDVAELPTDAITGGVNNQVKEKIAALEAKVNEIVNIENLSNC